MARGNWVWGAGGGAYGKWEGPGEWEELVEREGFCEWGFQVGGAVVGREQKWAELP